MKAIHVRRPGGRDVLAYTDVPEPTPGQGQVLVAIDFAGVNFIDVYQREGLYPLKAGDTCLVHAAAGGVGLASRARGP